MSTGPGTSVAVLLAAGAGTRLGRGPKALLPRRGRSLVDHAVDVLLDGGCDTVVVVLGAEAARVVAEAALDRPGVQVVVNDDWASGMASSLRAGTDAALGLGAARVVVSHVDQPGTVPDDVARLLAAHRPERVAVSRWSDVPSAGTTGPDGTGTTRWAHPLVLDAALAGPAAASARGDRGAREFLREHADLIDVVEHPGDGRDLDTESDLDLLS
ncbi:nucleotidyltransferase family protein [Cellulosimicrobium arenosum]|uniref:Nucleotidyltransferase family protein n=1 Tax=Cellulosimicrobium arenosum TaxID=2708133 RepID=A0A927IZ73_9MICO|nr:nucleotidyltransferase family protein [Cellulosimicrobium arenosum]MBD8078189.1 nucleotidyltransferase family protein [Cellulosimicrobium arenosum]